MISGCKLLFNIAVSQNVKKMRKLLKLFFPVITGILVMLGILKVGELIKDMADANFSFNPTDMGNIIFYYLLIPVTIIPALIIQLLIIQPIIKKLEHKPTFWRLRLMHYIILFSCIAAAAIGYIFWRKTELWLDVIAAVITSFVLFFIYFIITVLLSKGIDQFEIHFDKDKQHGNPSNDIGDSTKI
jgi:small-conductance mechanosensitive channel